MSLDDKLREVLTRSFSVSIITARTIAQIKQAFAEAGWHHSPLVDYQFKRIESGELMTGQEWFERFSAEIGKLSHVSIDKDYQLDYSRTVKRMLEAARKASGIENE